MKIVVIPRRIYTDTYNTKIYKETYFDKVLSSTADVEVLNEWSDAGTYNYLDEVTIASLNTKYTATIDNPVGHPSTSSGWFNEGINTNRMSDSLYTSQTVFTNECEVTMSILNMTHVIGQNLENVKDIRFIFIRKDGTEISTTFDCDACVVPATKIQMGYFESFDCDTCCNPNITIRSNFSLNLNENSCIDSVSVKIVVTKLDDLKPVFIGVLAVGKAHDLGCSQSGMNLELNLPNTTTSFPAIGQTGVAPANIETKISGSTMIARNKVDDLRELIARHGAFLNFYLFDEVDEIKSGIVLGRVTRLSTPITTASEVKIPIEIVGMQI